MKPLTYREFKRRKRLGKFENTVALSFIDKYAQKELRKEDWTKLLESWMFLQELLGFDCLMAGMSRICSERAPKKIEKLPFSEKQKRLYRKMAAKRKADLRELRNVTSRVLRINASKCRLDLADIIRLQALLYDFCKDEHARSAIDQRAWRKDNRMMAYEIGRNQLLASPTLKISDIPNDSSKHISVDEHESNENYVTGRDDEMNLLKVAFVLLKEREGRLRKSDVDTVSAFFLFWKFEKFERYDDQIRDVSLRLINRTKSFVKSGEVVGIYDPEMDSRRYIAIKEHSM